MELPKNKQFKDLTGQKFNRLLVLEYVGRKKNRTMWKCKCNCGNEVIIDGTKLKNSHTKSCGCLIKDVLREKYFIDLTGQKFGRLTVLEYAGYKKFKSGQQHNVWRCQCECGNETIVSVGALQNSKKSTKSCGCLQKESIKKRIIDLTGQNFGKLTVIKYSHNESGHSHWLCQCECGKKSITSGSSLKNGLTKSCGCRQGRFTHGMWGKPGYKAFIHKDPIKKLRHGIGRSVCQAIKSNGGFKMGKSVLKHLPYTIEELKKHLENQFEEWMTWDNYGGRTSEKRKTWWIDHIVPQSNFNFTSMEDPLFLECWNLSNLRPLEKIANLVKGSKP